MKSLFVILAVFAALPVLAANPKPAASDAGASRNELPALLEQLRSPSLSVRTRAVDRIGELGPQASLAKPALLQSLQDPEVVVRNLSAWALGRIGTTDPDTLQALVHALDDREWTVGHNASMALGALGRPAEAQVRKAMSASDLKTRLLATHALLAIDPDSGPTALPIALNGLERGDDVIRTLSTRLIGKLGSAAAPAVPELGGHLASTNRLLRQQVAVVLGKIGPAAAGATPVLIRLAAADPESGVRMAAITSLGQIRAPQDRILPALLGALTNSNERIAGALTWSVSQFGTEALPGLNLALRSRDEYERANAVSTLLLMGSQARPSVPVLIESLRDSTAETRSKVAFTLGNLGEPRGPIRLALESAALDTNALVRTAAVQAIQRISAPVQPDR